MQTIKYKFVDGTTNEVEVTEDIYLIHLELLQQEKRNHWKETRRHTFYCFTDMGIDFKDKCIAISAEFFASIKNCLQNIVAIFKKTIKL